MKTYIRTYDLSKVWPPANVLKWCSRNNFSRAAAADDGNDYSVLKDRLESCLYFDYGHLMIAHDGERYTGWGLAYDRHERKEYQCYVMPRQRRKGIGSRLLKKACSIYGRLNIYSHGTSEDFYKANGMTTKEAITGNRLKTV
jgi:GNAT superfamily N-acetyltransferase